MLNFLYTPVSWVLLQWHHLFNVLGLAKGGGLNWALSIVFLVITARLALFRVFVKQVHYQRHMQKMQPEIQKIRKKYKDDRAAQQREMMRLQQEQGFNPLAGCLPMFLQIPIFIALYHTLRHLSNSAVVCKNGQFGNPHLKLYTFSTSETCQAAQAKLFGAPLASRLTDSTHQLVTVLGGHRGITTAVIIVLVLISAAATFLTQVLVRSGNPTPPEGTAATVQKLMLYLIPLGTLFSGTFFPLGVLLYWFTSNIWTMGQQLYINKFHPHEDSVAAPVGEVGKTLAPKPGQRPVRAARNVATGSTTDSTESPDEDEAPAPVQRVTPRPGQRPQRPGGQRPPAKRPTQAKKRR